MKTVVGGGLPSDGIGLAFLGNGGVDVCDDLGFVN